MSVQTSALSSRKVPLREAAKQFGVHLSTIRRWIADEAPTVSPGEVGRGRGSIVDLDSLQRWLADSKGLQVQGRTDNDILALVAHCLIDAFKRDAVAERVGITLG